MKFKPMRAVSFFRFTPRFNAHRRVHFTSFVKRFCATHARSSSNDGSSSSSAPGGGNNFLLPGGIVATILMFGSLHARRMYEDRKLEDAREKGVSLEFKPDVEATFLRLLPLRSMSRCWGFITSLLFPMLLQSYVDSTYGKFLLVSVHLFIKHGHKHFIQVSPVDGTVLRFGELRGGGSMIEQVKGFSYSVSSLLGASMVGPKNEEKENTQMGDASKKDNKKSWWRVSLTSPKLLNPTQGSPMKDLFYCVIYLKPGDYHRIHSPVDWNVLLRRHFSGRLFHVNKRATRTIRNVYVENERVVLQGQWGEGFMALAAVGATNIGSIELFIEPELQTNQRKKNLMYSDPPDQRVYEPEGTGVMLKKGDEVATFNMGSTVVLVFQAPVSDSSDDKDSSSSERFCVRRRDRIRVGEALGRWNRDSEQRT